MKVKELKELLNKQDDETEVWLSSDLDGTSFSKLKTEQNLFICGHPQKIYTEGASNNEEYAHHYLNEDKKNKVKNVLILFPYINY
jgi:hypothetical protein